MPLARSAISPLAASSSRAYSPRPVRNLLHIKYELRARLDSKRVGDTNLLPGKADGKARLASFPGTLEAADADARSQINYWTKDQERKTLQAPRLGRKPIGPRGLRTWPTFC